MMLQTAIRLRHTTSANKLAAQAESKLLLAECEPQAALKKKKTHLLIGSANCVDEDEQVQRTDQQRVPVATTSVSSIY